VNYPTAWRRYSPLRLAGLDPDVLSYASIFGARYRFARAFDGVTAHGIREETVRGYETLMRLVLVQTSLEALRKVTGRLPTIVSEPLADRFRGDAELMDVLIDPANRHVELGRKKKQDAMIRALVSGDSTDLAPVLQRVRNMFAHGDSTSSRFTLDRKRRRRLLNDLADLGLETADRDFTVWVDRHLDGTAGRVAVRASVSQK